MKCSKCGKKVPKGRRACDWCIELAVLRVIVNNAKKKARAN